jgi:hypothetical protein
VEHIVKRDWIGQATRLAAKPTEERGLRATSYIVELFLDATNRVKGTKVHHVQSLDEEAWEDWDEARLLAFFTRRPELRLAPAAEAPVADEATATSASPVLAPIPEVPVEGPPPATPVGASDTAPVANIRRMEILPGTPKAISGAQAVERPLTIRLEFDLTDKESSAGGKLDYSAILVARPLGDRRARIVTTAQGSLQPAPAITLDIPGASLPYGIYRTRATITLSRAPESGGGAFVRTMSEGIVEVL